jgi:hypothetical protein
MIEALMEQYEQAIREFKVAENNFNTADANYIDTAIYKLKYCEERIGKLAKEIERETKMTPLTSKQESLLFRIIDKLDYIVQGEWLSRRKTKNAKIGRNT